VVETPIQDDVMTDVISRRTVLSGVAAAGVATTLAKPALAQASRPVKFTLAWLAQGSSAFAYIGKEKGFFKQRGIDLQISRGFGSLAAAQSVAAGQFEFGHVFAAPLILMVAKGLPLKSIGTIDYDGMMGVGVLGDGPIKTAKELAGVKIGTVPASAESPFFPAFASKVGFDIKSVDLVSVDPKVIERVLIDKEVAAITGVASSSLPVLLSRKVPARWLLYSSVGMPTAGGNIVTTPTIAKDAALCSAFMDAMMESVAFLVSNPQESADLFFKAVPEAALNADGKSFIEIGMGLHRFAIAKPPAIEHGLGWGDVKAYEGLTDLVMQYAASPDSKRPSVESWYTNDYAGHVKLTQAQWDKIVSEAQSYGRYLA
jgi:NitT/TauT family transport system substrate-binding protein